MYVHVVYRCSAVCSYLDQTLMTTCIYCCLPLSSCLISEKFHLQFDGNCLKLFETKQKLEGARLGEPMSVPSEFLQSINLDGFL